MINYANIAKRLIRPQLPDILSRLISITNDWSTCNVLPVKAQDRAHVHPRDYSLKYV